MEKQKLIWRPSPNQFQKELQNYLDKGWKVIPNTHVAVWVHVATTYTLSREKSEEGYFAVIISKEE